MLSALVVLLSAFGAAPGQAAEKQLVASIAGPELKGGILSEITWEGGVLMIQGVFAEADGSLKAQYFVVPASRMTVEHRDAQTDASLGYWLMKSSRRSPTGFGPIEVSSDTRMPQFGIGDLARRLGDAHDLGGTQTRAEVRLGRLVLLERVGPAPYDGEIWSWSPPALNSIAYVDAAGDLWVARADGTGAKRIARGDFTLPAWSGDGRLVAVAERKDNGRRWEVSVIHLPEEIRRPR